MDPVAGIDAARCSPVSLLPLPSCFLALSAGGLVAAVAARTVGVTLQLLSLREYSVVFIA
jgi:hypothetical protein